MAIIVIAGEDGAALGILETELEALEHDVVWATNGQDAYEAVLAGPAAMAFLDISMPVFNGLETCSMLRGDPDVPDTMPIILLTSPDSEARAAERAGATGELRKAHEAWELQELLSQYLLLFE
ncbi:MAG: response regulator [Nitrospiraceae bacterium]|nr:response regulator [Nitrospiraceae bacterium]